MRLQAVADQLIAAYRNSLQQADGLNALNRLALGTAILESSRAAARAVNLRSNAKDVAEMLDKYGRDLEKEGWFVASVSQKLEELPKRLVLFVLGGCAGLGAFLGLLRDTWITFGDMASKGGAHLAHLVIPAAVLSFCLRYIFVGGKDLARAVTQSDSVAAILEGTKPSRAILKANVDSPEAGFFGVVGGKPPSRPVANWFGPTMLIVLGMIVCVVSYLAYQIVVGYMQEKDVLQKKDVLRMP